MVKKRLEERIAELKDSQQKSANKAMKVLDIELIGRLAQRVDSLAQDCTECEDYLLELEEIVEKIHIKLDFIDSQLVNRYKRRINEIVSHLQKEHKLVTQGFYVAVFMPIGTSLGLVFGMTVFNNLALGLPIGISLGILFGGFKDSEAKKKGLVI